MFPGSLPSVATALALSVVLVGCQGAPDIPRAGGPTIAGGGFTSSTDGGLPPEDAGSGLGGDAAMPSPDAGPVQAPGIAPADELPDASSAQPNTSLDLDAGARRSFRVEVPAGEHLGVFLRFEPERADVVVRIDRWDGEARSELGLTDGGRGIRTLAVFEPTDAHTHWIHIDAEEAIQGTLEVVRTPFSDGVTCEEDCDRLLQLPLPIDPAVDGYAWTPGTVMRYQHGRRDLIMLTRYAAQRMVGFAVGPIYPEDFSQWDGETPGTDTGWLRHGSHQRGKDVDISLYGTDGLAFWRSFCDEIDRSSGGRECVAETVSDNYDAAMNAILFAGFYESGRVTYGFLDRELIAVTAPAADLLAEMETIEPSLAQYFGGRTLTHWRNHDNHIHVRVSEEPYDQDKIVRRSPTFEAP